MTPLERRIILYVLVLIAGVLWWLYFRDLQDRAAVGDMRGEKIEQTVAQVADNETTNKAGKTVEVRVEVAREEYNRKVQNDPSIATHRDSPVPERVRQLAHERRLARESTDNAAAGHEGSAQAANPTQR